MQLEFDPKTLDTPMVCDASQFSSLAGNRSCIKCRTEFSCLCVINNLYEKRNGTIKKIRNSIMTIELDDGRKIYLDKLWGCGGGLSSRIVVGARIKVYQHDWKLFYRLMGQ